MILLPDKTHYWLFNKLKCFEHIESKIIEWGKEQGLPIEEWTKQIYEVYGNPISNKSFEGAVGTSDTQKWLEDRIEDALRRHAALITQIMLKRPDSKDDLLGIYSKLGKKAGEHEEAAESPESAYHTLNDYLLDGMPGAKKDTILKNTCYEYVWETAEDTHNAYWHSIQGEGHGFIGFKKAWIQSFIEAVNSDLRYDCQGDKVHRIYKAK